MTSYTPGGGPPPTPSAWLADTVGVQETFQEGIASGAQMPLTGFQHFQSSNYIRFAGFRYKILSWITVHQCSDRQSYSYYVTKLHS
jgi:hypothetical protein